MAIPTFQRLTGRPNIVAIKKKAGAALVAGQLVTIDDDSYDVFAAATDKIVGGICMDDASSASTDDVRVDLIGNTDIVRAKVAAGTPTAAEKGNFVDIASSTTGVTLTESNNDARVVGWNGDVGFVDIQFTTLIQGGPVTATVSD